MLTNRALKRGIFTELAILLIGLVVFGANRVCGYPDGWFATTFVVAVIVLAVAIQMFKLNKKIVSETSLPHLLGILTFKLFYTQADRMNLDSQRTSNGI